MDAKHTATPWKHKQLFGEGRGFAIFWTDESKPGKWQRRIDADRNGEFSEEDAEFIVRACNAHDDLVRALKHAVEIYDGEQDFSWYAQEARAALAKASLQP